jgi:hypothetical protein
MYYSKLNIKRCLDVHLVLVQLYFFPYVPTLDKMNKSRFGFCFDFDYDFDVFKLNMTLNLKIKYSRICIWMWMCECLVDIQAGLGE